MVVKVFFANFAMRKHFLDASDHFILETGLSFSGPRFLSLLHHCMSMIRTGVIGFPIFTLANLSTHHMISIADTIFGVRFLINFGQNAHSVNDSIWTWFCCQTPKYLQLSVDQSSRRTLFSRVSLIGALLRNSR